MTTKDLTRGRIETLLLLDAIGEGCRRGELAERLGLCSSLATAVDGAARGLMGLVEEGDAGFRLTAAGRREVQGLSTPALDERPSRW